MKTSELLRGFNEEELKHQYLNNKISYSKYLEICSENNIKLPSIEEINQSYVDNKLDIYIYLYICSKHKLERLSDDIIMNHFMIDNKNIYDLQTEYLTIKTTLSYIEYKKSYKIISSQIKQILELSLKYKLIDIIEILNWFDNKLIINNILISSIIYKCDDIFNKLLKYDIVKEILKQEDKFKKVDDYDGGGDNVIGRMIFDISNKNNYENALCIAVQKNNIYYVKSLLENGANVNYNDGEVLCYACNLKNDMIFRLLIEYGADIKKCRYNLIFNANNNLIISKYLLDNGLNPQKSYDWTITSEYITDNTKYYYYIKLLLEYGAIVSERNINRVRNKYIKNLISLYYNKQNNLLKHKIKKQYNKPTKISFIQKIKNIFN